MIGGNPRAYEAIGEATRRTHLLPVVPMVDGVPWTTRQKLTDAALWTGAAACLAILGSIFA